LILSLPKPTTENAHQLKRITENTMKAYNCFLSSVFAVSVIATRYVPIEPPYPHHDASVRNNQATCGELSFHGLIWTAVDFYFEEVFTNTKDPSILHPNPDDHTKEGTPLLASSSGVPAPEAAGTQKKTATVSFRLTNPALPYDASCTATSNLEPDFFYGEQWHPCRLNGQPGGSGQSFNETSGQAAFRFDKREGRLDVTQSWICWDVAPPEP